MKLILLLTLLTTGCVYAPLSKKQAKEAATSACIHEMIADNVSPAQAFEICRQIYSLKKIEEQ